MILEAVPTTGIVIGVLSMLAIGLFALSLIGVVVGWVIMTIATLIIRGTLISTKVRALIPVLRNHDPAYRCRTAR
ncbi:MAG TPA: hypothetical protein VKB50_11980 [Vicinamibacterales bacterium]|nr:hypothetical protein [Vicinamibacterales bacterium]